MKNLVWLLFLPGFLCNQNPLKINPDSLFTWEGSCVVIPCQISPQYKGVGLKDISLLWYFQPFYDRNRSDYSGQLLYNSSSTSTNYRTRSLSASASQLEFVGNLEKKNCSLKISQIRTEDSGIYGARLFASYSVPVQRNKWFLNATINVAESPPDPKMDINPKDIREEERMTVTCSVPYHCPEEALRLLISGLGETRLSSQRTTIYNGVIRTVVNLQMTWEDRGKSLICSLQGQNGSELSKSTMQLDVKYAPKDVQLAIENNQLPIKENDTVTLNCSFSHSNPNDRIWYKWSKGKSSLRVYQENLLIFSAKLEEAGEYTCEACNTVKCVPAQPVTVDIHYAPKEVKVEQEPRKPIHEGNRINLRCEAPKANPKVDSYRWYKDGVQQHSDSVPDQLTIYPVTSEHSGRYWCEATNSVATSRSQQIMLNVYYGPRNVRLSLESQVGVAEGMDVSLLCAADANPPPHVFELYRDEEKLMERNDRILLLRKVQIKDSGDYHCKAYSTISAGESQTLMLSVSSPLHYTSAPATSGPEPATESEGPQSSPPPPSTTKGVSFPLPSASCPPCGPSQTPCDGRTLWEEFSFLSESQNEAVRPQTQFIHSCEELTSAVIHLTEEFRKALLQIRQRTRLVPSEEKKQ